MNDSRLIAGTHIADVDFRKVKEHCDERGSFTEIFQRHWQTCLDPVQWSCVRSATGVFRGMHLHLRHDEYFSLLSGSCYVGLKDIRPGSPTKDAIMLFELYAADMAAITFPRGLLHGWYFREPSVHVQAVSEAYVDYGHDDNYGCQWNAAHLDIPWPFDDITQSRRAEGFATDVNDLVSLLAAVE